MRTIVTLENSNCIRCHNAMLATLREMKSVHSVRSEFSSGCLVIEHEGEPDVLLAMIANADHAVAVAGNGEREMVRVNGQEVAACRAERDVAMAPPGVQSHPLLTMRPDGSSDYLPNPRSPSDANAPAGPACPVCHPDEPGAQEGIRVLTRERPTPSLIRRALQLVVKAYRVAFHLPVVSR